MRIAIDIRCLMEKQYSGVGTYALHLIQEILRQDQKNEYILFCHSAHKREVPGFHFPNVRIVKHHIPNKLLNFSLKFFHKPYLDTLAGGADIIFFPNIQFTSVSPQCKMITTIHDLSFERYPEVFSFKSRFWHRAIDVKKLARRSDAIIAVSEHTKRDLVELYKIPEEKINVIYSGISDTYGRVEDRETLERVRKKYCLPKEFILYLGNIDPRKNIENIISAYIGLDSFFQRSKEKHLVIAGAPLEKSQKIFQLMKKRKDTIHYIGYVDENDKAALYSLADIFVYPSLYEGFGFPPLEAIACGTPTITSYAASLPEVLHDSVIFIDPYNINDTQRAVQTLLEDEKIRHRLRDRGMKRLRQFQWSETARKVIGMFEKYEKTF